MESTCFNVDSHQGDSIMGPYSEEKQFQRADAIASLLKSDLPDDTRAIWEMHLRNLSRNEAQYNYRVAEIYKNFKGQRVIWEE